MVVAFNINSLSPLVPHDWFQNDTQVVSVQTLRGDNAQNLENQVIHLRVLACTMGTSNNGVRVTWTERSGPQQQRRRVQGNVTYNRYFMCADINNPPNCFVILTRTSSESASLLQHTHGDVIIGSDFYLFEPDIVTQYLGDHTPIVPHKNKKFLPLINTNIHNLPQATNLNYLNLQGGQAGYFVFKNKTITLARCSLVDETTCNGIMCDRQRDKGACTCLFTQAASNSYVYSFDVITDVNPQMIGRPRLSVPLYKSLRTTKCFFSNFERRDINVADEASNLHNIRASIRNIVHHVNNNGGWTVVGWLKRGEIADHGNEQERVQNNEVTEHISYLVPSSHITRNSANYLRLLISDDGHNGNDDHNNGNNVNLHENFAHREQQELIEDQQILV